MDSISLEGFIIDDREAGLFRVNRQAFRSPEILALEHERVFECCWIYAGHESEIQQPGDFCSRAAGGRRLLADGAEQSSADGFWVLRWLDGFSDADRHRRDLVCGVRVAARGADDAAAS